MFRIGRILIGYLGAALSGTVAAAVILFSFAPSLFYQDKAVPALLINIFLIGSSLFLIPAVCVIVAAEVLGIRKRPFFIIAGPAIGLAIFGLFILVGASGRNDPVLSSELVMVALMAVVSGLISGLVYWWLAGRFSGTQHEMSATNLGHGEA